MRKRLSAQSIASTLILAVSILCCRAGIAAAVEMTGAGGLDVRRTNLLTNTSCQSMAATGYELHPAFAVSFSSALTFNSTGAFSGFFEPYPSTPVLSSSVQGTSSITWNWNGTWAENDLLESNTGTVLTHLNLYIFFS